MQTREGSSFVFDPLTSYILFASLVKACLSDVVLHLWYSAKNVLERVASEHQLRKVVLVQFVTYSFQR